MLRRGAIMVIDQLLVGVTFTGQSNMLHLASPLRSITNIYVFWIPTNGLHKYMCNSNEGSPHPDVCEWIQPKRTPILICQSTTHQSVVFDMSKYYTPVNNKPLHTSAVPIASCMFSVLLYLHIHTRDNWLTIRHTVSAESKWILLRLLLFL